ncbi:MAG: oligosaccharide flippase family protein [Phycisphaerae bacterium]
MVNSPPKATPQSLSSRASRGFVWFFLQTLGSKGVAIAAQIILARLLSPHDFGLVTLAYATATIPGVLQMSGITQILVARQKQFRRWLPAAFWFELLLGGTAGIGMLIAAPIGSAVFHAPITGLAMVIAIGAFIAPLASIPNAAMMIDLRFRNLAAVGLVSNIGTSVLCVLLAWWGFGAYSFVIPIPLARLGSAIALWWMERRHLRPALRGFTVARWGVLTRDTALLLGGSLAYNLTGLLWRVVLRIFEPVAAVGEYFFASMLSSQVGQLLSQNLSSVLFPSLSKLQDQPQRQRTAFYRASSIILLVAVPLCFMEAFLARPLVSLIFPAKWLPAVPALQLLALASIFSALASTLGNLMQAQRRYKLNLVFSLTALVGLLPLAVFGTWKFGITGMAGAMLLQGAVSVPIGMALAAGQGGKIDWFGPIRVLAPTLTAGGAAGALAWGLMRLWPATRTSYPLDIVGFSAIFIPAYLGGARMLCPEAMRELFQRLADLRRSNEQCGRKGDD